MAADICGIAVGRDKVDTVLQRLAAGAGTTPGPEDFSQLARDLVETLGLRYALIGERRAEAHSTVHVLGHFGSREASPHLQSYTVRGSDVQADNADDLLPADTDVLDRNLEYSMSMPVLDTSGTLTGIVAVLHNDAIVDQATTRFVLSIVAARVESALQRQRLEEQRDNFFALTQSMVGIVNPEGYFEDINPAFSRVLGYPREFILQTPLLDLVHPEDQENTAATLLKHDSAATMLGLENRLRTVNGDYRWLLWNVTNPASDRLIYASAQDITTRKQAVIEKERRLRGIEAMDYWVRTINQPFPSLSAFYTQVCAAVKDLIKADLVAVPMINAEGSEFTYVAALGDKAAMLSGQTLSCEGNDGGLCGWVARHEMSIRVENLSDDPRVAQTLARQLQVSTGVLTPVYSANRIVGGLSAFRDGAPFDALDEELLTLLGHRVSTALDNLKLLFDLENRVASRTDELARINQELRSFSYSVSHDLRAPLRSVDGFARALLEDYSDELDETGADYLQRMRQASQKMAALIDDLLKLSRLSQQDMAYTDVDLTALCQDLNADLQQASPDRHVDVQIENNLNISGDTGLLRVAMTNLLGNAWKYTQHKSQAEIRVGKVNGSKPGVATFYVRDNGVGLNMDYADKLFSPFQRLHTQSEFPGTGIGLAIVARIINRHGGRVWVEAAVGEGSTFYMELPASSNGADAGTDTVELLPHSDEHGANGQLSHRS